MSHERSNVLRHLLEERFSCRSFLPNPLPRHIIRKIFELGQLTPSWCNTQPWHSVVCEGSAARAFGEALSNHAIHSTMDPDLPMPPRYDGVFKERRREAGWALYSAVGVERGDREAGDCQALRNYDFFGAPAVAVITAPRSLGVYSAVDCGLYVQTLLLAATSLGVASIAQASLATFSPFVRDYLGISEDRMIVCGASFGYRDPENPANSFRTTRAPLGDAVTWRSDPV